MMFEKKNTLLIMLLVAALTIFGAACGEDDDGNSSNGGDSGLDKNLEASELTEEDEEAFCDALEEYSTGGATAEENCEATGVLTAILTDAFTGGTMSDDELQAACAEATDSCLNPEEGEPGEEEEEEEEEVSCMGNNEECSATVGELEACYHSNVDATQDLIAQLPSCDDLTRDFIDEESEDLFIDETTSECQVVEDACPDYFEDPAA